MIIEEAIYSRVSTGGTNASTRVYPFVIPQDATLPAIAYQRVSGPRSLAHDGNLYFAEGRFQFTCTATTYAAAKALVNQVRALFHGFKGLMGGASGVTVGYCAADNEIDGYNQAGEKFTVRLDVIIHYQEP